MIEVVTKTTKVPIQAKFLLIIFPKEPITISLVFFPMDISIIRRGIDHKNRKRSQAIMNAPPQFWETIRGKRHMFPVPTAIPIPAKIIPQREVKYSLFCIAVKLFLFFYRVND